MVTKGFKAIMSGDKLNREDEPIHITYGLNDPLLISTTHIISLRAGACWTDGHPLTIQHILLRHMR